MFDHPTIVGYPTYCMRAATVSLPRIRLGQKALSNGKDVLDFKLQPGQSDQPSATRSSS